MKKLRYLLYAMLLLAYSLVFAEFYLRIFSPQVLMPRFVTGSDIGIRQNISNVSYHHVTQDGRVDFSINSQGMRDDRDFQVSKPKDACRVLIFGDSFFMSYEVSFRDSYAQRLESYLRSSGMNCEVLNFAVSGFGTAESLLQLQKRGVQFDPDYVVLEWHHSDVDDNLRSDLFSFRDDVLLPTGKSFLPGVALQDALMKFSVYRWMIQYSHLYTAIREVAGGKIKDLLVRIRTLENLNRSVVGGASEPETKDPVVRASAGANLHSALVNEFFNESRSNGARMLLVHIPFQNYFGDFESALSPLLGRLHPEIVLVDPVFELKNHFESGRPVFHRNGHLHLNPDGYDIVARETAKFIVEMAQSR